MLAVFPILVFLTVSRPVVSLRRDVLGSASQSGRRSADSAETFPAHALSVRVAISRPALGATRGKGCATECSKHEHDDKDYFCGFLHVVTRFRRPYLRKLNIPLLASAGWDAGKRVGKLPVGRRRPAALVLASPWPRGGLRWRRLASGRSTMDWKCNLKQTLEALVPLFAIAAALLSASAAFRLFDRYLRRLILATAFCAVIAAVMQLAITYFLPLCRAFA
jgi:hypothetical protein